MKYVKYVIGYIRVIFPFGTTRILEIHEIQQILGIGRNKVYDLIRSGEIAAFKIWLPLAPEVAKAADPLPTAR